MTIKRESLLVSAAAVFTVIIGAQVGQRLIHSVEDGQDYLEQKGYTEVSGGTVDHFNACGKNTFARSYNVTSPEGEKQDKTVCFWFGAKYEPLIGN